jgi:hypothetical protein
MIDSYRLHQIQPFAGDKARITATCYALNNGEGWEVWF